MYGVDGHWSSRAVIFDISSEIIRIYQTNILHFQRDRLLNLNSLFSMNLNSVARVIKPAGFFDILQKNHSSVYASFLIS